MLLILDRLECGLLVVEVWFSGRVVEMWVWLMVSGISNIELLDTTLPMPEIVMVLGVFACPTFWDAAKVRVWLNVVSVVAEWL